TIAFRPDRSKSSSSATARRYRGRRGSPDASVPVAGRRPAVTGRADEAAVQRTQLAVRRRADRGLEGGLDGRVVVEGPAARPGTRLLERRGREIVGKQRERRALAVVDDQVALARENVGTALRQETRELQRVGRRHEQVAFAVQDEG